MISRYFYGALVIAILVAAASMTTFAQVGELRGKVWMQQADGQKVPLPEAQIDVFRVDMAAKYNTKTDKKGEFVFAGLPFIGTYTVAASHPTAMPAAPRTPDDNAIARTPCPVRARRVDGIPGDARQPRSVSMSVVNS